MSQPEKLIITAPGSTANLGPGFDSVGLALNCYTTLEVSEHDEWLFIPKSPELAGIPAGKENLVYEIANTIAEEAGMVLPPSMIEVTSDIPLSRGLGSSAAAIVTGVELANQLLHLGLTVDEKVRYASSFEGHPDNAAASVLGGLVIGSHREDSTDVIRVECPNIEIIVYIPSYEVKTENARSILPATLDYKQAVLASGISNVLVAALMQKNWKLAGKMMSKDLFHQPYRGTLVPEMNDVISIAEKSGAYGAALSGAGPTIICFAPVGKGGGIRSELEKSYPDAIIKALTVDDDGLFTTRLAVEQQKQPF
jgi:homoserine kinase